MKGMKEHEDLIHVLHGELLHRLGRGDEALH